MDKENFDNLKIGQIIIVNDLNQDLVNNLNYTIAQLDSCQSLYNTFMSSNIEEVNNISFDKMIQLNTDLIIKKEKIMDLILKNALGDDNLKTLKNKYLYEYDINMDNYFLTIEITGGRL